MFRFQAPHSPEIVKELRLDPPSIMPSLKLEASFLRFNSPPDSSKAYYEESNDDEESDQSCDSCDAFTAIHPAFGHSARKTLDFGSSAIDIFALVAEHGFVEDILNTANVNRESRNHEKLWKNIVNHHFGSKKRTRLMYSSTILDLYRLEFLIECGANRNATDIDGKSAIDICSSIIGL